MLRESACGVLLPGRDFRPGTAAAPAGRRNARRRARTGSLKPPVRVNPDLSLGHCESTSWEAGRPDSVVSGQRASDGPEPQLSCCA